MHLCSFAQSRKRKSQLEKELLEESKVIVSAETKGKQAAAARIKLRDLYREQDAVQIRINSTR